MPVSIHGEPKKFNETDVNQQKFVQGMWREGTAWAGAGTVQLDFDLAGKGRVSQGEDVEAQQEQRQHHKEQGTSGSTKTFLRSH